MKLYSVKINLDGSLLNQVVRDHVSAAEIVLLRAVHGDDAVNDITHTANVNRSDRAERARLAAIYSITSQKGTLRGADLLHRYLGIESQPLPDEPPAPGATVRAEDFSVVDEDAERIELVDAAPIKRTQLKLPTLTDSLTA